MIALVRGEVCSIGLDHAVVIAGGVGYRVLATPATLAGLRLGVEGTLHTTLVVREDSQTLFGFAETDERDIFDVLMTVSGVGPRLALAALAVHTPDGLRRAVAGEDLAALQRVPGIGRKGAQRMVLELAGKLGVAVGSVEAPAPAAPTGAGPDVVEALVGLGWNARAADAAVAAVLERGEAPDGDAAAVLRAALRELAGVPRG
ncbi:Holliday junction branch migration protein RuvA [Litorihabitans aurantiacus]|uniref:Holliday junction branch migration complex subunit RuvA n=1 Tax=Litorihabitans aurantiacus TaxID=1930061 RepID=A0AA37XDX4_9MICO|nr:Holliday junction branch migration protein RuvA [Litorihabitans aurantiacus]GMA31381.1 Holliday junction ATP-dependent DNA helicase RuvA [Litorihabitans aurantiacus]